MDTLPRGVRLLDLEPRLHERGSLTELYREDRWPHDPVRQWNLVTSPAGVMRGIHVHTRGAEYYVLLAGRALIGYQDIRAGSPTLGGHALVELSATESRVIVAPSGLAHGVYSLEPLTLLVGMTSLWDPANERGCHWKDPALAIPWPFQSAIVSSQDAGLGRLEDVMPHVPKYVDDGSGA